MHVKIIITSYPKISVLGRRYYGNLVYTELIGRLVLRSAELGSGVHNVLFSWLSLLPLWRELVAF